MADRFGCYEEMVLEYVVSGRNEEVEIWVRMESFVLKTEQRAQYLMIAAAS